MQEEKEDFRWKYHSFDFYKEPKDKEEWLPCPECKLTPRVWIFDNGRYAHCVCGNNAYDHTHSVSAISILDVLRRDGNLTEYKEDELRDNWNTYIKAL